MTTSSAVGIRRRRRSLRPPPQRRASWQRHRRVLWNRPKLWIRSAKLPARFWIRSNQFLTQWIIRSNRCPALRIRSNRFLALRIRSNRFLALRIRTNRFLALRIRFHPSRSGTPTTRMKCRICSSTSSSSLLRRRQTRGSRRKSARGRCLTIPTKRRTRICFSTSRFLAWQVQRENPLKFWVVEGWAGQQGSPSEVSPCLEDWTPGPSSRSDLGMHISLVFLILKFNLCFMCSFFSSTETDEEDVKPKEQVKQGSLLEQGSPLEQGLPLEQGSSREQGSRLEQGPSLEQGSPLKQAKIEQDAGKLVHAGIALDFR